MLCSSLHLCTYGVVKDRYIVENETLNTYFTTNEKDKMQSKMQAKQQRQTTRRRQGHNIIGNGNDDEEIRVLGVSAADRTH